MSKYLIKQGRRLTFVDQLSGNEDGDIYYLVDAERQLDMKFSAMNMNEKVLTDLRKELQDGLQALLTQLEELQSNGLPNQVEMTVSKLRSQMREMQETVSTAAEFSRSVRRDELYKRVKDILQDPTKLLLYGGSPVTDVTLNHDLVFYRIDYRDGPWEMEEGPLAVLQADGTWKLDEWPTVTDLPPGLVFTNNYYLLDLTWERNPQRIGNVSSRIPVFRRRSHRMAVPLRDIDESRLQVVSRPSLSRPMPSEDRPAGKKRRTKKETVEYLGED